VHRFGYALALERKSGGSCFLRAGDRRIPLAEGVNVIGRDEDADICINSPEISRRHVAITIGQEGNTIEDLGSKNGTFLGKEPVKKPIALRGGEEIYLGRYRVTFHVAREESTRTITGIPES
jgi:pSer/pThr/pTyr-binding forkhead associated (FHA) protein